MSGETDLDTLIAGMRPELVPGVHVFATLAPGALPPDLVPRMILQEAEGTTLILLQSQAEAHGIAHEFPCRMITLNVHSSLAAVGFIARIASLLAARGMGVNPVSGFYHDHLFVPDGREAEAMHLLTATAAHHRPA